jgi:hypothetical protein
MTAGYHGGNGGMLPFRSQMFVDGGRARVAPPGGRTWRDDRRDELRRQGYGVLMRIVFPRPLRVVRDQ